MPLRDHFRPPLSEYRPWDSFHTTWATSIADALNDGQLPAGLIALEHVHAGAPIEIDVATFTESSPKTNGKTLTLPRTVWTPSTAARVLPANFPEGCTIEILSNEGGRRLVAAIELVSPGNKDRVEKRRLFAAKCATYLARGVGLVIVDVVTIRLANMHDELMDLLGQPAFRMPSSAALYCAAYRPLRRDGIDQIDTWPMPLAVGQPLPTVPLSLDAELCIPVDLESAYLDACERRRFDEVPD